MFIGVYGYCVWCVLVGVWCVSWLVSWVANLIKENQFTKLWKSIHLIIKKQLSFSGIIYHF